MSEKAKICLRCRYCALSPATPDYSEVTPGEPAEWYCAKRHWYLNDEKLFNPAEVLTCLETAEKCPDYESEK